MGSALNPACLGSTLEELLAEDGTLHEVAAVARRRVRQQRRKRKAVPQTLAVKLTAQRVRDVCARQGRTLVALARQAEVSGAALTRLLKGTTEPQEETLRRLHATLDRWEAETAAEGLRVR